MIMKTTVTTTWTKEELDRFKKEYNKAVKANKEYFNFEDKLYYTQYAKYLIEYLTTKLL